MYALMRAVDLGRFFNHLLVQALVFGVTPLLAFGHGAYQLHLHDKVSSEIS